MILKTSTMKPGLLVALRTSVTGNVHHNKTIIDSGSTDAHGRYHEEWQTERVVADKEEYEAANKVRDRVRGWVVSACVQTSFTLLCLENRTENLERAYNDAQRDIAAFNSTARITRISLNMITSRIAHDDTTAMKAINREVSELIEEMSAGVSKLDAKAIRNAATRAKNVGKMLAPGYEERLGDAIAEARKVATKLVAAGEQAAVAVDAEALALLNVTRTTFLDLDDELISIGAAPAASEGRTLDFEPEAVGGLGPDTAATERQEKKAAEFEME